MCGTHGYEFIVRYMGTDVSEWSVASIVSVYYLSK